MAQENNAKEPQNTVDDKKIKTEVEIGGIKYTLDIELGTVTLTPKEGQQQPPVEPEPTDPTKPPVEKPDSFGTIKEGAKWSKNPGKAETWKVINMDKPPEKFKIITESDNNLNFIADLESKDQGLALIEYFKVNVFPPKGNDGSEVEEPGEGPTEPLPEPGGANGPYATTGQQVPVTQRGVTKRNYRSGKHWDWTIEKNAKEIPFKNQQAIFDITVNKDWMHDDNLSIKGLGQHMGSGWFDNGISIYEGQTCLGIEPEHPKTKLCVIKGKKYGDLRGKRLKICSTFFIETFKTEFWVNIPGVTDGWDKAAEGTAIGGFKPKLDDNDKTEIQLRIDGFQEKENPPEIHSSFIQEIKLAA